jgi:hypothetical protein
MTTTTAPRFKNGVDLDAAIEATKEEICRDIAAGLIPLDVRSFDGLSRYTDMNCFLYMDAPRGAGLDEQVEEHVRRSGGDPEELETRPAPSGDALTELVMEARALVVEAIDGWLEAEGHLEELRARGILPNADDDERDGRVQALAQKISRERKLTAAEKDELESYFAVIQ